ncbi:MAG: SMC-Scp complex subunit ScpB [Anaerolineaceae bacterium]|nr:SMC-Scp complex subunit ScpB [Anaerolineaceae bacterium]
MSEQTLNPGTNDLQSALEALLFVAAGPVSPGYLAEALDCTNKVVENELKLLSAYYSEGRGLRVQRFGGKVQLTTAPHFSQLIEHFLGLEATSTLSRAALEALAIVAYRQPVTRPGIDAIRGVNSDGVLRSLLSKGLIEELGRAEGPGRPILYGVTTDFLQYFGLASLEELPPFEVPKEEAEVENNGLLKD